MRAYEMSIAKLNLQPGDTLVVQVRDMLPSHVRESIEAYIRSKVAEGTPIMVLGGSFELSVLGAFKEMEQPASWQPAPWWQFWRPASGAAGGAVVVALTLGAIFALAAHHIHAG